MYVSKVLIWILPAVLVWATACSKAQYQFNPAGDDPMSVRSLMETSETRLRIAGRGYVATALGEIFGPAAAPHVTTFVTNQVGPFGGEPCDPNGTQACNPRLGLSQLPLAPNAGSIRMALVSRACQMIVSNDAAVTFAARLASGVAAPTPLRAPAASDHAAAFNLFYAGKPLSAEVAADLRDLVQAVADSGGAALEQWRLLLGVLCESPGWQVL